MRKYIVRWDAGYGDTYEIVEAESYEAAVDEAYELWKEEAATHADYGVESYTPELAEEYGLE